MGREVPAASVFVETISLATFQSMLPAAYRAMKSADWLGPIQALTRSYLDCRTIECTVTHFSYDALLR